MSFLNFALLGGAAAFLVPLVIHLLNRSRHQSMDWGAMHLLEAALQVNSRRFQWESILLLLLRCLIPILFAIGLARPVLTSVRSSAAQGDASLAIMLDNSLSMTAPDSQQPNQSKFDRATSEVRQLLSRQRNAEITLWSSGGAPQNALEGSTVDSAFALRGLANIEPGAGPCDPLALIEAGATQLSQMANPNKQLVIVSDFQASQWSDFSTDQVARIMELVSSAKSPIQLSLIPVGEKLDQPALDAHHNLSVELSPECWIGQLEPIFVDDPVRVSATIHNWGNQPVDNVKVVLQVDDQALAVETLNLQPNSKQQVQFGCSFKSTGQHRYTVQLQAPQEYSDKLQADDAATAVLHIHEPIRIIIVDPASSNRDDSIGRFVKLALSPAPDDSGFQVQLLSRMPPQDDFRRCSVLVVVGTSFDDGLAGNIASFVDGGGGLLVVPDDNFDHSRLNRLWFEKNLLLPSRYLERKSKPEQPQRLKQQMFQDTVLSFFNSGEHGDLTSVQSQLWHPLEVTTATGVVEGPQLKLEDDTLVMAKRTVGRGSVIQFGLSPNPKWSNLSTRPVFVPLIQRLVIDLLGEGVQPPQQLLTGQTLSLSTQQFHVAVGGLPQTKSTVLQSESAWTWIDPTGNTIDLQVPNEASNVTNQAPNEAARVGANDNSQNTTSKIQPSINFPMVRWPGIYRLKAVDAMTSVEEAPVFLAAAAPSSESDLKVLSDSQLEQLANRLGATIASSADDYQAVQQVRRDGKEIWRPLLMCLLIFLFAEIVLAKRITRGA